MFVVNTRCIGYLGIYAPRLTHIWGMRKCPMYRMVSYIYHRKYPMYRVLTHCSVSDLLFPE
jgi:hypothetical protein